MSALTSLLVRDHKVPVRKIEEAIQRQVITGGGLDTILLEGDVVLENEVASYCAAGHGLLAASRDECMGVGRDVVRKVPSEVAERHRLVPLSFDGHRLVVALSTPLSVEVEQQLGFLLGVTIEQRIASEARIAAALAQHYAIEMVPRMRRLNKKLSERAAGGVLRVEPLRVAADNESANTTRRLGTLSPQDMRSSTTPTAKKPSSETGSLSTKDRYSQDAARVSQRIDLDGSVPRDARVTSSLESEPADPPIPPAPVSVPVLEDVSVARRLQTLSALPPPPRISVPRGKRLQRHRGPLTARRAVEILKEAESRDEILEIAYAFFRQFFDLSALFVISDGEAEGHEISGPGADLSRFERLGVPLDEPSALKLVFDSGVPTVTLLDGTETERRARSEMARVDLTPALLLPVAIRTRVVLIFYGDRSGELFDLSDVPEPVAFAPWVSEALQRLIIRRKLRKSSAGMVKAPAEASSAPNESVDEAPPVTPRTEAVVEPPRELTNGESHIRWSEPPPTAPERRSRGRRRSMSFEVLGVPRSAPPPPMSGSQPSVTAASPPTFDDTLTDGVSSPVKSEPAVDAQRASTESASETPVRVGTYVMKGGSEEIVHRSNNHPAVHAKPTASRAETALSLADTLDLEAPDVSTMVEMAAPDLGETDAIWPDVSTHDMSDMADVAAPRFSGAEEMPAAAIDKRSTRASDVPTPLTETLRRPSTPDSPEEVLQATVDVTFSFENDASEDEPSVIIDHGYNQEADRDQRRRNDTRPGTPSVIVEMDAGVESAVEDLRYSGPEEPEAAVREVLRHGEAALPALIREFPGPLFFDRTQSYRRLPRGRDISAFSRAIVAFGDLAVPYVISLLSRSAPDTRFYAVLLSSEFSHARLVRPLGERILDEDRGVASLALDVVRTLKSFERENEALMERFRAEARSPRGTEGRRRAALRALGELRDAGALTILLRFLEHDRNLGPVGLDALRTITHQDFGNNVSRWRQWIDENESRHRVEWIIDALNHSEENVRKRASSELTELTQEYYGFHHALPKKEREIVQKKYRAWWKREGAERFGA